MEIKELLEKQARFNTRVTGYYDRKTLVNNLTLALFTEVAEFANELSTFKHWKNNHSIDYEKAQEEYVDILLIWSSLADIVGFDFNKLEKAVIDKMKKNNERQDNGY